MHALLSNGFVKGSSFSPWKDLPWKNIQREHGSSDVGAHKRANIWEHKLESIYLCAQAWKHAHRWMLWKQWKQGDIWEHTLKSTHMKMFFQRPRSCPCAQNCSMWIPQEMLVRQGLVFSCLFSCFSKFGNLCAIKKEFGNWSFDNIRSWNGIARKNSWCGKIKGRTWGMEKIRDGES